jgi:single-stranded-DNA-specific exonuclease
LKEKAAFLGVTKSLSGRIWQPRLDESRLAEQICQRHELPDLLGRILAARGVEVEEVEAYLNPTLRTLMPQPGVLVDMEHGAERLATAISTGERIGVISDYDVDGICSAALLRSFLRATGSDCLIHIPDRLTEGYGPSEEAVHSLNSQGCSLLLTLDCGVMAHDPLAEARKIGLDVVVVDHHQASAELPLTTAVINPNRQDDLSGLGYLCAAGVTMILVAAVNRQLRNRGWYKEMRPEPNLLQWLELVALATICDVVPLKGLNRAYVTQGLKILARRQNLGLAALADAARLKRPPDAYALGYILGPRLNAAGRIGNAMLGLQLLSAEDRGEANQIAGELEGLNRERQGIELDVLAQAMAQAEASLGTDVRSPVILVAGEGWHPGVLGLVAARLKERYYLPSLALGYSRGATVASGSGRSIPGIDLGDAIRAAGSAGLILKGGGHALAAGLTVELARLLDLRAFLEERLSAALPLSSRRSLEVDAAINARGVTLDLIELIEQAGPYGAGNPPPILALPAHRVIYADAAGSDHIRCTLAAGDGTRIKAIAFRALGTAWGETILSERQQPLHFAGRLAVDDWNGKRSPSFQIEDVAAAS